MKNREIEKIAVSDLGLASLLTTLNFPLLGMERVDERRINLLFAQNGNIEKVVRDYWAGVEFSVSMQSLFANQKMLKNRLYNFKQQ